MPWGGGGCYRTGMDDATTIPILRFCTKVDFPDEPRVQQEKDEGVETRIKQPWTQPEPVKTGYNHVHKSVTKANCNLGGRPRRQEVKDNPGDVDVYVRPWGDAMRNGDTRGEARTEAEAEYEMVSSKKTRNL